MNFHQEFSKPFILKFNDDFCYNSDSLAESLSQHIAHCSQKVRKDVGRVSITSEWFGCVPLLTRDIDNNGYLDATDFACLAVRTCVLEGKGDCSPARLSHYQHIMKSLWEEISDLADFDKDGKITVDEFKNAVQNSCVGKKYEEFPQALKAFIEANFRLMDQNQDGVVGIEEYRYDCIKRMIVDNIEIIDEAYNKLINDEDRKLGGLTLARYQECFAQFLSDQKEGFSSMYLFGPLDI